VNLAFAMRQQVTAKQLRSFGVVVGGVFALIGFWPALIHGFAPRWWMVSFAALTLVPALFVPAALRPLYRIWMAAGSWLGWINTNIILSIGFYGLVTPIGLLMRLFGNDPLHRKHGSGANSYRVMRGERSGSHVIHQF